MWKQLRVLAPAGCAICLEHPHVADAALVKPCEHVYCLNCILRWTLYREHPTCPQASAGLLIVGGWGGREA